MKSTWSAYDTIKVIFALIVMVGQLIAFLLAGWYVLFVAVLIFYITMLFFSDKIKQYLTNKIQNFIYKKYQIEFEKSFKNNS